MIYLQKFQNYIFSIILCFGIFLLFYIVSDLSISYKESIIYFDKTNLLHYLVNFSVSIFGNNDYGLRVPFITFYVLSVILFYKLCENYFLQELDRLYATTLFMFLPGVFTSALLVNSAIIVIFCTLLYLYLYKRNKKHNFYLLAAFLFIDNSFSILYLSIFFYGLIKKENQTILISLLLFGLSMSLFGFDGYGKPRGYFLDTVGIYASIFSPIIFLYFVYTIYRKTIKGNKTLFWIIPSTALYFSLLLSFRQKILVEDFAPFLVISVAMMVKLFFNSYRVRLKRFRKKHNIVLAFSIFLLIINLLLIVFSKQLYLFIDNPRNNFAYKYHFANEISQKLKENHIDYIKCSDYRLEKRLNFYGIKSGEDYYISHFLIKEFYKKMDISLMKKNITTLYIKKIK